PSTLASEALLPGLRLRDDPLGLYWGVAPNVEQRTRERAHTGGRLAYPAALALRAELRHAHPHARARRELRAERGDYADGAVHLRPVVDAWAEDELCVVVDADPLQARQVLHDLGRPRVADERHPQLRVGAMHRDVDRTDPLLLDPLPVLLGE